MTSMPKSPEPWREMQALPVHADESSGTFEVPTRRQSVLSVSSLAARRSSLQLPATRRSSAATGSHKGIDLSALQLELSEPWTEADELSSQSSTYSPTPKKAASRNSPPVSPALVGPVELSLELPTNMPSLSKLLFSNEGAAKIVRFPFVMLANLASSAVVVHSVASRVLPVLCKHFPMVRCVTEFFATSQHARIAAIGLGCVGAFASLSMTAAYLKWSTYMRPIELPSKDFLHVRRPGQPEPENVAGVLFDVAAGSWHVWPRPSLKDTMSRALAFTGTSLRVALHLDHTVGIEYPLVSLGRLFLYYLGYDNKTATRQSMYFAIVNTSVACFIDYDESSPTYSHVVLRNTLLPAHRDASREFSEIVVELNHDTEEVIGLRCTYQDGPALPVVTEIYGRAARHENTHAHLTDADQVNQVAQFICAIASNSTHTMVHWFANGTGLVDSDVWATAALSTGITNWMNTSACVKTSSFFGDSIPHFTQILTHNVGNGLPMHGSSKTGLSLLQALVSSRSRMHSMAKAVRARLVPHIEQLPNIDEECRTRHLRLVEAIVTATVLHSADHYYVWEGAGHVSDMILPLDTDMGGLLRCLVRPIAYKSVALLVKHHVKEDAINAIIYEECLKIDPKFANTALSVGCAY